jgi:hypothetical protein
VLAWFLLLVGWLLQTAAEPQCKPCRLNLQTQGSVTTLQMGLLGPMGLIMSTWSADLPVLSGAASLSG